MTTKFPAQLDTDAELHKVADDVDDVVAAHHNDLVGAIRAMEEKLGIDDSPVSTSVDYILKQLAVKSEPPEGNYRVVNLYYNGNKLQVDCDDTPVGGE